MAELSLNLAIPRFKANENRIDIFTNGDSTDTFLTSNSVSVPCIQKFLADWNTQINLGTGSILSATQTARDAAAASAAAAANSASEAATWNPSSYYTKIQINDIVASAVAHANSVAGTADAITAAFLPAFTAWAAKMRFRFTANGANTIAAPTVNVDGLGAKPIKKLNKQPLLPGDITGVGHICDCVYDGTDVILLNFASVAADREQDFTAKQTFSKPVIMPITALTDAGTIAWDMNATSNNVKIILPGGRTLGAPSNMTAGQVGLLIVQQDVIGGWSLTFNGAFDPSGSTTTADIAKEGNAQTVYRYEVLASHIGTLKVMLQKLYSTGRGSIGFYREYDVGALASGKISTVTHDVGAYPAFVQGFLQCTSGNLGYSVGDRVNVQGFMGLDTGSSDRNSSVSCGANTTKAWGIVSSTSAGNFFLPNKSTGALSAITLSSWKLVLRVFE